MRFFEELQARGVVEQVSDPGLPAMLDAGGLTVYAGFDPTADSLHLGSLMPVLGLARMQRAGHRPIALVGGATGMVGDPSGKSEERRLLDREELDRNLRGIEAQLRRFLDFDDPKTGAVLVDNASWFEGVSYLGFLRDVGKHFPLGLMLSKESVKLRLEREQGISYTEFSYMLVQAYDFLVLHDRHGCRLQIGGSDQWGNITAGIELIRRVRGAAAYGATMPLITNADGKKFGKSEQGNVWLDAARTSPYAMFQFLLNTDDRDVGRYLKLFTFRAPSEIDALLADSLRQPERREAQRALARDLVTFVHGAEAAAQAEQAAGALFAGDLDAILNDPAVPSKEMARATIQEKGMPILNLLRETPLAPSVSAARRDIEQGGIYINGERVTDIDRLLTVNDLKHDRFVVLRKGKKNYFIVKFV